MEFLLEYGLTNEEIEEIKNRNDSAIIDNIILNQKNVRQVIDYLLEVGINKEVIPLSNGIDIKFFNSVLNAECGLFWQGASTNTARKSTNFSEKSSYLS